MKRFTFCTKIKEIIIIISSPERSAGRAIVLPLTLALANVKDFMLDILPLSCHWLKVYVTGHT